MSLVHFDPDPGYGTGVYRRLVRITVEEDATTASIDDTHHAMWVRLRHRVGAVTDVDAAIERGPATSCSGAPAGLGAIKGMSIRSTASEITARLVATDNCTHLGDLIRWAMRNSGRTSTEYRISVPDAGADPVWIEIRRDERVVHRWLVDGDTIVGPPPFAGRPLARGFHAWASALFDADDLETALMLQRGAWVARARRYLVDRTRTPLRAAVGMEGACYSYSGQHWATATNNLGYVRDFTDGIIAHALPPRAKQIEGENRHDAH